MSKLRVIAPLVLVAFAFSGAAYAQATATGQKPFEPQVGQAGKDVVWVPTPQAVVDKMLDMAKVTKADVVFDLGSGDGRTVITAAKRGARAYGIEYNPDMVTLSQGNAKAAGVADRATFESPHQYPVGIEYVIVNGAVTIQKGEHTGALEGHVIYGPGKK